MPDPAAALADFVTYVQAHLTGDEKGEAADYLDRLFRALGHAGVKEAGATRETRGRRKFVDVSAIQCSLKQTYEFASTTL